MNELNLGRFQKYVEYLPYNQNACFPTNKDTVIYYYKHPCVGCDDAIDKLMDLQGSDVCLPVVGIDGWANCNGKISDSAIQLFYSKIEQDIINKVNILLNDVVRDIQGNLDMDGLKIYVSAIQHYLDDQEDSENPKVLGYANVSISFFVNKEDLKLRLQNI